MIYVIQFLVGAKEFKLHAVTHESAKAIVAFLEYSGAHDVQVTEEMDCEPLVTIH